MEKLHSAAAIPMRRSDRAVTDEKEICEILDRCKVCNLAIATEGAPYVVPLNFGYSLTEGTLKLFFHSAKQGRKVDLLKAGVHVGFAISRELGDTCADDPCHSGSFFESVLGSGTVSELCDASKKCAALTLLMRHQFGKDVAFVQEQAEGVCVFCVSAETYCGKRKIRKDT